MNNQAKKVTTIAMLCAIAYVVMAVGRFPVVLFLKYDPSDVIVTLGGFIWGPMTSCITSVVLATIEMITVSDTGIIGWAMNIVQTLSFACVAAYIYKKKHTLSGAVIALATGWIVSTAVMMLWNYLLTPIYTCGALETVAEKRKEVATMLIPVFLPFNLLKGGLNASITFLLYKPVITALRKTGIVEAPATNTKGIKWGHVILAFLILVTCVLFVLSMNETI